MAFTNAQHRKRYAEDPNHRAHKLAANRAYRMGRRDELNARWREKWHTNTEYREGKRARRWVKYGLAAEDYARMVAEQGGVCAICKRKSRRWLCVDHCHATQLVRGLLCDKCNSALGFLDDDPERMRAAGAYVDRARGGATARGAARLQITAVIPTAAFELRLVPPLRLSRRPGP